MAENVNIILYAFDKTAKAFASATKGLKAVAGAVLSARNAIVALVGAGGFALLINSSLKATDSLAKTAAKIGTTTEALGALRYAADLTGVSTETMDMALQRFTRRTAEAAKGMGEAKGAIKELGIDAQELNRLPLDERMIVLADAFQNVKSESDRLRLAFKLFDSEGAALVNTLSQGSEGLKEMLGEARALGLSMSSSAAKGVEDTVDSLTKLQALFKGVTDQVVAAFAPALEAMVETFTEFLQESIKARDGVENFARTLAIGLLGATQAALQAFEDLANGFIKIYNTALKTSDALTKFFTKEDQQNARQLKESIDEVTASISKREEKLKSGAGIFTFFEKNALQAEKQQLASLQALLEKTEETGRSLMLLDEVNFASGLNAQIDTIIASLDNLPTGVTEPAKELEESVSDIKIAFEDWKRTIPNTSEMVQDLTKKGLNGLTDALTAGITGAAKFSDAMKAMAKSVVDSLIKMLVQKYIVDAAFGFITSGFSPPEKAATINTGADFRGLAAIGGSVQRGDPYLVGERGAEIFVPNQSGSIIPNNRLGGSGVVVNQTINVTTGVQQTVRAEIATLMPQIANAAKSAVADARMRGGGYSKALVGA